MKQSDSCNYVTFILYIIIYTLFCQAVAAHKGVMSTQEVTSSIKCLVIFGGLMTSGGIDFL